MFKHNDGLWLKVKKYIIYILEFFISQKKVEAFLFFWAKFVARLHKPFIIGVTGTVGKSTTTEMIASVLKHQDIEEVVGTVGYTLGNMNDDVGLPATLLRFENFCIPYAYPERLKTLLIILFRGLSLTFRRYPKIMVLEFGTCWSGHLHRLVKLAPPNISIITTIGAAHLERLKTLEGVVIEKSSLVRATPASGLVILGTGHRYVSQLEQMSSAPVVFVEGKGVELSQNITRAVCQYFGISGDSVNIALKNFKSLKGRLNLLEYPGMTVIDDTYNANPLSMKLGLDTIAEIAKPGHRKVAILGEMGELGSDSISSHLEIGAYARRKIDVMIGVGKLAKYYNPDLWFDRSDICADQIENFVNSNDYVLVKGSASTRMSILVNKLQEISHKNQGE